MCQISQLRIISEIWGQEHPGVKGRVNIDNNGDSRTDFSLLDMDPSSGIFRVVRLFRGGDNSFHNIREVHWPGNRSGPPPDVPKVGWKN